MEAGGLIRLHEQEPGKISSHNRYTPKYWLSKQEPYPQAPPPPEQRREAARDTGRWEDIFVIGSIVTFRGDPPSALEAPDVAKVIDFFRQQNEILKLALTTCVIVPEGATIKSLHTHKEEEPLPSG